MKRTFLTIASTAIFAISTLGTATALPIFVDQDATYRYINATASTDVGTPAANWFASDFDDSSWSTGQAPFANRVPASTILNNGNQDAPFDGAAPALPSTRTQWDVQFDPYLRTTFELATATNLTIWLAVDNGINSMYINGVLATAAINAEGHARRWEHVFDIDSSYLFAGTNVIALQLEDHGGDTGFTMVVSGDDAADNPEFTNNPPPAPVPAPGALLLLGFGLLGLGIKRRAA